MRRQLFSLLCFMLASTLGLGAVAHASEPVTCVEAAAASSIGHTDSDTDQVPADAEKGYPHHHGSCHGHHVGVPIATDPVPFTVSRNAGALSWEQAHGAGLTADPALRPPQA